MRNTVERRQSIVLQVQEHGRVDVDQLAQQFKVSTVTIRSDLNELDSSGFLVRCRGGALAVSQLAQELTMREKYSEHSPVKKRLGATAAKLIENGESILLDSGTTTEEIARNLAGHENLKVMTNGLNVANALTRIDGADLMVTGGSLRKSSLSFSGRVSEQSLEHLHFDKVFLGVDGFDLVSGVTTHNEAEAILNRLMCKVASEVIAVTDSSKFGKKSFHVICQCENITTLVTDDGMPAEYVDALTEIGVDLHLIS